MKKAYSVHAPEDGVIVFASNSEEAQAIGAMELYSEVHLLERHSRELWADPYAEKGWIPAKVMLKNGWSVSCIRCSINVFDDSLLNPIFQEDQLYCSIECKNH